MSLRTRLESKTVLVVLLQFISEVIYNIDEFYVTCMLHFRTLCKKESRRKLVLEKPMRMERSSRNHKNETWKRGNWKKQKLQKKVYVVSALYSFSWACLNHVISFGSYRRIRKCASSRTRSLRGHPRLHTKRSLVMLRCENCRPWKCLLDQSSFFSGYPNKAIPLPGGHSWKWLRPKCRHLECG